MVEEETIKIVQKFMEALKSKVKIDKVIIYGSRVSGKAHKDSDIDIAIVSSDFGKDRFEEGVRLRNIASLIDPRIEPVPISRRAYEKDTWVPLIYEIRQKGREIYPNKSSVQKFRESAEGTKK